MTLQFFSRNRNLIFIISLIILSACTILRSNAGIDSGPTYFKFTSNTGNNATVVLSKSADITVDGYTLQPGDEIGVFTPDSLCVGAVVWPDSSTVIVVWGNNPQTPEEKDGIDVGEQMHFRIWRKNVNAEFVQNQVVFSDQSHVNSEDTYKENSIYIISLLTANDKIISASDDRLHDGIPDAFHLHQNFPNPFNPSTVIRYDVAQATHVTIEIFNLIAQRVAVIVDGFHHAGSYEIVFHGDNLPSGVYLYTMSTEDFVKSKRFILLQ
jgi:hypothetical protein